jgi:CRP/FNR family transcriptional regulator, cyclic AMP receptor protein
MSIPGVFKNASERRQLAAGEMLFQAGDTGDEMFGVVSGRVELRRGDDVVAVVEPGETFGEMAIIDEAPRALAAVATEATEVAVINRRMFLFLVHETPMFALQVMQSLSLRVRQLD